MHASYGLSVFFYLLNHLTVNIKHVKKLMQFIDQSIFNGILLVKQ